MHDVCNTLGVEKRRPSSYRSQGNGFAERNIRTVKDILRTGLLHGRLAQNQWRKLLFPLVFAFNATISKATHCIPFNVVFGRSVLLPQDIIFQDSPSDSLDPSSAIVYEQELRTKLNNIYNLVLESLEISKTAMQRHYNKTCALSITKWGKKLQDG